MKKLLAKQLEYMRLLGNNWRLLLMWPACALILGIMGWTTLLNQLNVDRQVAENAALREAGALARGYADHLARTIETIDQILLHVRYEWKLTRGNLQLESVNEHGLFPSTSDFNVGITDRTGLLLTNTIGGRANVPPATDRAYFYVQRGTDDDVLYAGEAAMGRASKRSVIHFSRKIVADDGGFDGVVRASISPEYLTANHDPIILGENGLIGIIGLDGLVRAVRTGNKVYQWNEQSMTSVPRLSLKSGASLLSGNEWFSDKRSRFIGWDRMDKHPLIAVVGLDEEGALAAYRNSRALAIRRAIQNTTALAVFALIAMGLTFRLAWRKHQVQQIEATYRMATEGGNEGFYIARPIRDENGTIADYVVIDCNRRGAEFLQLRREELVGRRFSIFYPASTLEHRMEIFEQAMEKGIYEGDLEEPSDGPLIARWVHLKVMRSGDDLAVTLRDISDTKRHIEELERRSNEDALTGLPNRQWVQNRLPIVIERAAEKSLMLALLFIDLDGFKAVNDTVGHEAGDEVLRNAARRLKVAVRPHDRVARLGGDEFVVIIEHITRKADAAHVAERILHAFADGFRLFGGTHSVGTSIGISVFPNDGGDAESLLRHADIAMYSVKLSGKRNYRFYDAKYSDVLRARTQKEEELRYAIEHNQFVVHYQPRVDIFTGITSSMEALVRWAHPTKGLIGPNDFISLAEETGLILRLGELVIDLVCAQLAHWSNRGQELVPVSVNVSSRQFNETDVANIISSSLARHNIDPKHVEIELTESSMMGEAAADALASIQKIGIKILVDDFGTGYSSLSQLQKMDFDVLKVDQAFTSQLEASEEGTVFFKTIITMAHTLGMKVVAEGVENIEQVKILKDLKCDEIQGFYISKPLPPSEKQPILPRFFLPSTA
ncbi:EAL domain-containing protein [Noviherbaspirillum saxi]|uniref:EAL domain-containing protein n=1 Tax=Noviherbaspirillum saxi TaxID=2320863 RepID=A0A3A3FN55_9BURK|nr:EAL domain-containing protein [Noviherbaspirillum saxi]RJF95895.1 EAL domain-containing protein [Noviherbaspirillum saxi]